MNEVRMRRWWAVFALLLLMVGGTAHAQDEENREKAQGVQESAAKPWSVDPYWQPISYLQGEFVSGPTWVGQNPFSIQIVGGMGGGLRYRQGASLPKSDLHLFGYSRAEGVVRYEFITLGSGNPSLGQGFGLGAKLGSFFGIDGKWVRATTGPDFWADFFQGVYLLEFAPGLSWRTEGYFKFTRDFWFHAEVSPGWAFGTKRHRPGFLDQLEIRASFEYFGEFQGAIGWRVQWNSAGRQTGPFIAAYFK